MSWIKLAFRFELLIGGLKDLMSEVSFANSADKSSATGRPEEREFVHLLIEARAGSSTSLGLLFETCRKYLLTIANDRLATKLQSKVGASDLVQDTFFDAQKEFVRFTGQTERELLAWLAAILSSRVMNEARHHLKIQKRSMGRELPNAESEAAIANLASLDRTPGTEFMAREEECRLRMAFDQLSSSMREIIIMRIWSRLTFVEIGDKCGISADAARKQWARAVIELQTMLQSQK